MVKHLLFISDNKFDFSINWFWPTLFLPSLCKLESISTKSLSCDLFITLSIMTSDDKILQSRTRVGWMRSLQKEECSISPGYISRAFTSWVNSLQTDDPLNKPLFCIVIRRNATSWHHWHQPTTLTRISRFECRAAEVKMCQLHLKWADNQMCLQDESVKESTGMKFHLFLTGMSKNIYSHWDVIKSVRWPG